MVSHELRTPLSVILGNITLALRGRFGAFEPALGSRLETIQKRANQLNLLIENLLNLSRLETGRLDIRKMPVYVEECVDDALAAMADEIRARNHLVEKKLSPDVPAAYADHDTFVQALTNIISNAVKFTPEGGHIEIISRPHKTHEFIELVVKDNGVGIPEKVLPHVFDRFYQADNTTTRSFGGTGIGLSIAKEIIDMHEGQIRIESTEGKGTEVIFSLPRPEVNGHRIQGTDLDARAPEAASLDDALAGPPRTLLLVDDDPDFLDMLCDTFQNTRFKILTAETAASAIELLRSEHPHLVLLDLMMNDMNGFEFIENVRTDTSLSNIPIIVVTASANDEHRARAISLGASDYLTKPLDSAELFKKISSVIG
jgi:CheY-like chemotaxis protein/two-component sensor histidine kinase